MKGKKRWSVIAALLFICICGIFSIRTGKDSDSVRLPDGQADLSGESSESDEGKITENTGGTVEKADEAEAADSVKETVSVVVVHVCGAVRQEGVYELPVGARVADAIEAAGGAAENAAGEYLNQAEKLTDGIRIYVPDREEAEEVFVDGTAGLWQDNAAGQTEPARGQDFAGMSGDGGTSGSDGQDAGGNGASGGSSGKININRAGRGELMTLPGIGESKADAIIAYRQGHGDFKRKEDLMKISGIKEGVFQKIEEFVTVE